MMNEDNSCVIRFRRTAEVLSALKIWSKEKKQVVHKQWRALLVIIAEWERKLIVLK